MGPQLFLDKSVLQSLSEEEIWCLNRYYLVVYAPVQFIDILLQKKEDGITEIATKIQPTDQCFTMHYRISVAHNLLDRSHPDRLPSRIDTILTDQESLPFGVHPEKEALRCWNVGEVSTTKQVLSERWRSSTRTIDLDKLRKGYNFPSVTSFAELKSATLALCDTNDLQQQVENFEFLLDEAELSGLSEPIRNRWFECGMPSLKEFAPYAYYCLTVFTAFYTAMVNGLIGTRISRVALEYLFYLPFCQVFCSNDPFHKQFVPLFLGDVRSQQDFVDSAILKQNLKQIYARWKSMPETEQKEYLEKFGHYPPELEDSITNQLWEKYMPPRTERNSRRKEWEEILTDFHKTFANSQEEKELIQEIVDTVKEVRRERAKAAAADLPSDT